MQFINGVGGLEKGHFGDEAKVIRSGGYFAGDEAETAITEFHPLCLLAVISPFIEYHPQQFSSISIIHIQADILNTDVQLITRIH